MFDKFISSFQELKQAIKKQKKYIRSSKIKQKIENFYEKQWLPYSLDFKKKFGRENFSSVEDNLYLLYTYSKKDYFEKKKVLTVLSKIDPVLEKIKHELIRKYGYVIKEDKKRQLMNELKRLGFNGTLVYLKDAEKDYINNKWKSSCFNSRLALEEFLREFREKSSKNKVNHGTVGDHISVLKNKLAFSLAEIQLIKGFYGFLSNKGGHATTYKPSQEDAKIAIYLNLICVEFLLEKFGKYLN